MRLGRHAHPTARPRWALGHRQFDLTRTDTGRRYLTRWWLVATPLGGIALHRLEGGDARSAVHDHPFAFVSVVPRGGYTERRLDPRTMTVDEAHVVRRVNVVATHDAHTIVELARVPSWTLLFVGRQRRTWGFWEKIPERVVVVRDGIGRTIHGPWTEGDGQWRWTRHDAFDSGVYAPERARP